MDDRLQEILDSRDPGDAIREIVDDGPMLRVLSQHIFYSFFSSYVSDGSTEWTSKAAETALQILAEGRGIRYGQDWLLEMAFHGSLVLAATDRFFRNIARVDTALEELEKTGATRSSQYIRGLLAYARDDLQAAENAFSALQGLSDSPLLAHHAGYAAFRAPGFYRTLKDYDPTVSLSFAKQALNPRDASVVLLCASDDLYFSAFAAEFVKHALGVSPSVHIHFHLINNRIDLSRLVAADLLSNPRVSITNEMVDSAEPGTHAIMARYIILPALLRKWNRPVLVTDIDLIMRKDPALLIGGDAATLCISRNPKAAYIPAAAMIGHHNMFQPTKSGIEFAELLSRYLHYMHMNGRALWAADQVALLIVWRMLRNTMPINSLHDTPAYAYGVPADRAQKKKAALERLSV